MPSYWTEPKPNDVLKLKHNYTARFRHPLTDWQHTDVQKRTYSACARNFIVLLIRLLNHFRHISKFVSPSSWNPALTYAVTFILLYLKVMANHVLLTSSPVAEASCCDYEGHQMVQ
jgi:hypothetical protein